MIIAASKRAAVRITFFIKPAITILLVVAFFFLYNSFLVNKNLESLKFYVTNIAHAQTVGAASYMGPIMQAQVIEQLSTAKFTAQDITGFQYAADVINTSAVNRNINDVTAVMEDIVERKENSRNLFLRFIDRVNEQVMRFFKKGIAPKEKFIGNNIETATLEKLNSLEAKGSLDEALILYKDTINRFPDYAQTPGLMLRMGFLLNKIGKTDEAKAAYAELMARYPDTTESKIAKDFRIKLEYTAEAEKKTRELTLRASQAAANEKQKLYYEAGLLQLSVLNIQKAKETFLQAISIGADADITAQSYLRLGICEKILGNISESNRILSELVNIAKDPATRIQARYQMAQNFRMEGDYDKATLILKEIANEEKDRTLSSQILFQAGSICLYDMKDVQKANDIFNILVKDIVSRTAMSQVLDQKAFVDFASQNVQIGLLTKRSSGVEKFYRKTLLEKILPKDISDAIENGSMTLVRGITDGLKSIIIAKEGGVKPGDYVTIELTQNRLNEYIREWFPPRKETSDVRVTFDGNKGLTVYGKIKQAKGDVDGFISGRFKIVSGGLEATVDAGNFVIFEAEKCKIGKVLVTPMLVNALLRRCIVDFNRDLPIIIKEFELDASNILFAGPVKEDFAISGIEAEAAGWQQRERASAN